MFMPAILRPVQQPHERIFKSLKTKGISHIEQIINSISIAFLEILSISRISLYVSSMILHSWL